MGFFGLLVLRYFEKINEKAFLSSIFVPYLVFVMLIFLSFFIAIPNRLFRLLITIPHGYAAYYLVLRFFDISVFAFFDHFVDFVSMFSATVIR